MADDQQPRDDAAGRDDDAVGRGDDDAAGGDREGRRPASDDEPGLDQTREFDPFAEPDETGPAETGATDRGGDATAEQPAVGDETAPMPPAGREPTMDETMAFPAGDETAPIARPGPTGDETTAFPPPDATTRLPPADQTAVTPPAAPGWSGRAEVRPPGPPGGVREPAPGEWDEREVPDGRRWWLPIVVGLVALLLVGLLGFGIWLAVRANEDRQPVTPATTSPVVSTTAPATSAPPTTPAEPTTAPATTAVALVAVPPLAGLDESIARDILDDLGLGARTETRESNERPAGTVIETDPGAGEQVPVGEVITLIIATEPPPTAPPTTEPPATESPGTGPSE